ncbi:MAG: hypothetical protein V1699_03110 [Candidatus Omnitrophota bacterium]
MSAASKRKKYLIHPSSQFRFLLMTIFPALITSIFCIFFLISTGQLFFFKEKIKVSSEVAAISDTIEQLSRGDYPPEAITNVEILKHKLAVLKDNIDGSHYKAMEHWAKAKMAAMSVLVLILFFSGIMSIIYSHRIAGPLYRLAKSLDMLAEGQDVPLFHFRAYDEFQELAASFDRLRKALKDKGYLK